MIPTSNKHAEDINYGDIFKKSSVAKSGGVRKMNKQSMEYF